MSISITPFYYYIDRPKVENVPWYLDEEPIKLSFSQVAQDTLSFLVLYNYIIPISLYVTLELQKFFGSLFLTWDLDLYDEETGQSAKCNSSDLNEELGQVIYNIKIIQFSDGLFAPQFTVRKKQKQNLMARKCLNTGIKL